MNNTLTATLARGQSGAKIIYFAIKGVDLYHSRYSQNHPNSKTSKLIRKWDFKQIVVATASKKSEKKRYEFGVWDEH